MPRGPGGQCWAFGPFTPGQSEGRISATGMVRDPSGSGWRASARSGWVSRPPSGMREVTEMTQIKLLVVMAVPEDQRDEDASRAASFSDEVNAILRFDGGWRLTMSGTDYPRATEEGIELAGAADDPPVKEAIEAL